MGCWGRITYRNGRYNIKIHAEFWPKTYCVSQARDWSHAVGGHWTERPIGSEGSGWSDSGMAQSPTPKRWDWRLLPDNDRAKGEPPDKESSI